MRKEFLEHFPLDAVNTYETLKGLRRSYPELHYRILSDADFQKIADPLEAHSVYWNDMLKRIHIVLMVSSFKTLRWMEAIDNNIENFYGFCSALRGLVDMMSPSGNTVFEELIS